MAGESRRGRRGARLRWTRSAARLGRRRRRIAVGRGRAPRSPAPAARRGRGDRCRRRAIARRARWRAGTGLPPGATPPTGEPLAHHPVGTGRDVRCHAHGEPGFGPLPPILPHARHQPEGCKKRATRRAGASARRMSSVGQTGQAGPGILRAASPSRAESKESNHDVARAPSGDSPSPGADGLGLRERATSPDHESAGVPRSRRSDDRACGGGLATDNDDHDPAAAGRAGGAGVAATKRPPATAATKAAVTPAATPPQAPPPPAAVTSVPSADGAGGEAGRHAVHRPAKSRLAAAPGQGHASGEARRRDLRPREARRQVEIACTTCHHPSRAQTPVASEKRACSDCHTMPATPPMKTSLQAAFHDPRGASGTCIDCHKQKGGSAPVKCLECHKKR